MAGDGGVRCGGEEGSCDIESEHSVMSPLPSSCRIASRGPSLPLLDSQQVRQAVSPAAYAAWQAGQAGTGL
jgi:hypothetical protein